MSKLIFGAASLVLSGAIVGPWHVDKGKAVTYEKDIRPIFEKKCTPCHVDGGPGPFSLASYQQLMRHRGLAYEKAISGEMPPVHGVANGRRLGSVSALTDSERVVLQEWARTGLKRGDPAKHPTKVIRVVSDTTSLDYTFAAEQRTNAEGAPYWLQSSQPIVSDIKIGGWYITPDSPKLLRYVTLGIVSKGVNLPAGTSYGSFTAKEVVPIGTWAPGYPEVSYLGNHIALKKGDKLVALAHFRPNGKTESARIKLGLRASAQGKPIRMKVLEEPKFVIPSFEVPVLGSEKQFGDDAQILGVVPEARFYASTVAVLLVNPTGAKEIFRTDKWNPYWVGNFMFPQPLTVKKGESLRSEISYSNDQHCSMNQGRKPDPVHSGPGPRQEVCRVHLLYVE